MPGRCVRCGDSVYFAEEVRCQGLVWHSTCLRCENCKKLLDSCSLRDGDGNVYCSICYRKFKQFSGSQTREGELSNTTTRTRFSTPPPARGLNDQSKEWISPRQSKSTGKLLNNQNFQYIKSKETFHNNNNRSDKDLKRTPTKYANSAKDVKNSPRRINTFKHVVQGSSSINHNLDDLRCKVPVSFKLLTHPNKSPTTGSFKPQHPSEMSTKKPYCVTSPNQEPQRALRKAFNFSKYLSTPADRGRKDNLIHSNKFKASAQIALLSKSNNPVVNINTSLDFCQKCNKQVYQAERIRAAGGTWHVSCFTCYSCQRRLDSGRLCERGGHVFCSHCYHRNFGPRGTGYGIGANYQT